MLSNNRKLVSHVKIAIQILWHIVFVLSITQWKDVPTIPYFAKTSEILDRNRWFWLMDVPKSSISNASLILSMVHVLGFAEIIICVVLIYRDLRNIWKYNHGKIKWISLVALITAVILSMSFEHGMYMNFIDMSEYYYLWQSIFSIEIMAMLTFILWILKTTVLRSMKQNR